MTLLIVYLVIKIKFNMNDTFFKIAAIISPIITGLLVGFISYKLSLRGKKFDLLHQHKVPAINELITALVNLKKDAYGAIAREEGHEFSPFYNIKNSSLEHRTIIAEKSEFYSMYLNESSRNKLDNFIGKLYMLCSIEISMTENKDIKYANMYQDAINDAEDIIKTLYKNLGI
ncbi:hypothetical protein CMT91_03730 [Elizabethkingia anophelis]|nr:hypothetical protein [Elizabethkingia anophelis]